MILLLAATPFETSLLRKQMSFHIDSAHDLYHGESSGGEQFCLLHTGIGPTSTAISLTRHLEHNTPQAVLMIGCGGSYPNSGLQIGDLALATEEVFGDLGVMTAQGFLSLEEMEIPVNPPPVQRIQLDTPLREKVDNLLQSLAKDQQKQLRCGPFVTVSSCSGHPHLSQDLEKRTGGICENMEGAAAAQVCSLYRLPFLELRGISNPTGTRDPQQWNLKSGTEAAQWGLLKILERWPLLEEQ